MEIIKINVCGQIYNVPKQMIKTGPQSRLKRLYNLGSTESNSECFMINRTPESFAAILAFYQNGELHIPMTSCPGAFMAELEYWEISPEALSECCYNRLQKFLDEQETLSKFRQTYVKSKEIRKPVSPSSGCLQRFRTNIWETINYNRPSVAGKIYLLVAFIMVLMSIFVLAYSTDQSFHRELTNCERLQYMDSRGIEGYETIKPYLEELCILGDVPVLSESLIKKLNLSDIENILLRESKDDGGKLKRFVFTFIHKRLMTMNKVEELEADISYPDWLAEYDFENSTEDKNTSSLIEYPQHPYAKTLKPIPVAEIFTSQKDFIVPNIKIKMFTLIIFEGLTTIFFTIEFVLRLSTCPNFKVYFLSVIDCSDALSLLGSYLYFFLYLMFPHLRYGSWIDYLAYLQTLRSLRFFRLVLNMKAGIVLAYSVRRNIKDLVILILFLFAGMCTFGTCIYIAEDNAKIESIPDAWYLSIVTMTTVGYGDIYPETKIGRFICCLCAVAGVVLLAITVPMFANHFLILYNHTETENVIEKYKQKKTMNRNNRSVYQ